MGKGALGLGLEQRAGLVDGVDVDVCVELSLGDSISRIVTAMVLKMSSDGVFLDSVETSACGQQRGQEQIQGMSESWTRNRVAW
jgi:hypothetical protein